MDKVRRIVELQRARKTYSSPDGHEIVACSVFGPRYLLPASEALLQVFVHTPTATDEALWMASQFDEETQHLANTRLWAKIPHGTTLTVRLTLPKLQLAEDNQIMIWNGRPESVAFGIAVPPGQVDGAVIGTVAVMAGGISVRTN
jgi:hypothetical protein